MTLAADPAPELRTRLRADIAIAADILVPNWPLSSFIAVNPLGGLEAEGFERAVREAAATMGARGHLEEARFRELAAGGRITDADLLGALERRHPGALAHPPAGDLEAADVLLADLRHAPEAPTPASELTSAERVDRALGTSIAAAVDDEVDGWCAAFLDEGQAALAMPDRHLGLYGAWRAVGAHDRGLRRLGAGDLRRAIAGLPEDPADAIAAGFDALGLDEAARPAELRRHLGRRPGWASAIRWRAENRPAEQDAPADLVDLIAVRVSLEALLVRAAAERSGGLGDLQAAAAPQGAAAPRDDAGARIAAVAAALGAGPEQHAAIGAILGDLDPAARPAIWQAAYEEHYRVPLLRALDRPAPDPARTRPLAQTVFCIDARSEGLRRHLEQRGDYETLGFAGFFAVAMRFRRLGSDGADNSCPVLLTPRNDVTERAVGGAEPVERFLDAGRRDAARRRTVHHVREEVATPFAMAEASGWVLGPVALAKTLTPAAYDRGRAGLGGPGAPSTRVIIDRLDAQDAEDLVCADEREIVRAALTARLGRRARRATTGDLEALRRRALGTEEPAAALDGVRLSAARETDLLRELRDEHGLTARGHRARLQDVAALGFSREEQIGLAKTALVMMGLTRGFGRLVLLCGHGSRTENNPYEAALDCGACGGNQGGPNARVAAAMLNRPYVRDALRLEGIEVPEDTFFLAGQHDTSADTVTVFDRDLVPASHLADLERLEADLHAAGAANSAERLRRLPGAPALDGERAHRHAHARGRDWAQIRPEWGLARNAAFIVGGRHVTRDLDLECRTFLHSYDAAVDADGAMLETILTAPLVVAQWINCQYYFSTVDPEVFGAGNKTLHNVVAGLGVLQGPGGDLRLGLPLQGALDGDRLYHEPMRLLAIVEAPLARIDDIVDRNPILQDLLGGEWVSLAAREHPGDPWLRREPDGTWVPYLGPAPQDAPAGTGDPAGAATLPSAMAVTA